MRIPIDKCLLPRALLATALVAALGSCCPAAVRPGRCEKSDLHVVAHPDDDLLFMSPAIPDELAAHHCVEVVFVTEGDAGQGASYVEGRRQGLQAAYALMAGAADAWSSEWLERAGRPVRRLTLSERPEVRLDFLGLPDGNMGGEGFGPRRASLAKLWAGQLRELVTVDGQARFSHRQLTDTLQALLEEVRPSALHLLDASGANGVDHSDHRASALFALEAEHRKPSAHLRRMYRGYNISREKPNLSPNKADAKWQAFLAYAAHDPRLCRGAGLGCLPHSPYAHYLARQYLAPRAQELVAVVSSWGGLLR